MNATNEDTQPAAEAYVYGYARVSTRRQDLARQLDALQAAGIPGDRIYTDKASGSSTNNRPGLAELIGDGDSDGIMRRGDTLAVVTLDRLGRNLREMLNLIHDLHDRGIGIRAIKDNIDTSSGGIASDMMTTLLLLFAELERRFTNERAEHARAVRRANGKQVGRKRAHSDQSIDYARLLREQGHSYPAVAEKTGIPVASLYRYLNPKTDQPST